MAKDNFHMSFSISCERTSFRRSLLAVLHYDRSTAESQRAISSSKGTETINRAQRGAQQRCVPSRSVGDNQQVTRMPEIDQSAVAFQLKRRFRGCANFQLTVKPSRINLDAYDH